MLNSQKLTKQQMDKRFKDVETQEYRTLKVNTNKHLCWPTSFGYCRLCTRKVVKEVSIRYTPVKIMEYL